MRRHPAHLLGVLLILDEHVLAPPLMRGLVQTPVISREAEVILKLIGDAALAAGAYSLGYGLGCLIADGGCSLSGA